MFKQKGINYINTFLPRFPAQNNDKQNLVTSSTNKHINQ
ncbi:hypothetical protein TcasGA2_TC031976 [Tribolium castaneum]|uniref:Uncharacterized protein n=1 Tax=Tribolium castaneum TaxID=7070 RepID=A0A139WNI4_TRICA|nr:hypothetical protein TcasGA2_TC031976 [Tribolium castaneum]